MSRLEQCVGVKALVWNGSGLTCLIEAFLLTLVTLCLPQHLPCGVLRDLFSDPSCFPSTFFPWGPSSENMASGFTVMQMTLKYICLGNGRMQTLSSYYLIVLHTSELGWP